MRPHSQSVSPRAADASDVVYRSIRIRFRGNLSRRCTVTEHDAIIAAKFRQRAVIAEVISFHVADGNAQHFAFATGVSERRVSVFDPDMDGIADVYIHGVAYKSSGELSDFAQYI